MDKYTDDAFGVSCDRLALIVFGGFTLVFMALVSSPWWLL